MSRTLAEYLGVSNASFLSNIRQLESAASDPGLDIKLALEIASNSSNLIARSGLDPSDTTNEEVYLDLNNRFLRDDKLIQEKMKELDSKSTYESIITYNLKDLIADKNCFALKHSTVKRHLKKNPPKNLLKKLGYRSLDSLLKREALATVLACALLIESNSWRNQYYDNYKKLTPSDFESRKIEILQPRTTKNWTALSKEILSTINSTVISSKELGGIIILPIDTTIDGLISSTIIFALDQINQIRIFSVFAKIHQVRENFGTIIADASQGKTESLALIAGQNIPWHIIQKFYDRFEEKFPVEIFEPHVQVEDTSLINIEDAMSKIHASLEYFLNSSCCAVKDKLEVVSFNIKDVAVNALNKKPYSERCNDYFRESLWSELILRYISQSSLEESLNTQMDNKLLEGQTSTGYLNPAFGV